MIVLRNITAVFLLTCLAAWILFAIYIHLSGWLGTYRKLHIVKNGRRTRVRMNYRYSKELASGLLLPSNIRIELGDYGTEYGLIHEFSHIMIDMVLLTAFGFKDFMAFSQSKKGEQLREILAWGYAIRAFRGAIDAEEIIYALETHGITRKQARLGLGYAMNTLPTSVHIMLTAQFVADVLDDGPVSDFVMPMDMEFFGDS